MISLDVSITNIFSEPFTCPLNLLEVSTHSLHYTLPPGQVKQLLRVLHEMPYSLNVWYEQCHFDSDSPAALHLREKVHNSKISAPYVAQCRVNVLEYKGGQADLHLTASRKHFSRLLLEEIADEIASTMVEPLQGAGEVTRRLVIQHQLTKPLSADPRPWLKALSLMVAHLSHIDDRVALHIDTPEVKTDVIHSALVRTNVSTDRADLSELDVGMFVNHQTKKQIKLKPQTYRAFATVPYPLTFELECCDHQAGWLSLHFDSERFSSKWVKHIVECLIHVATQLCTSDVDLDSIEWVPEHEWKNVLVEGHDSKCVAPKLQRIEETISKYASDHPNAVALRCANELLTYRQLDQRSSAMAVSLLSRGVNPADRVGVCLERSPELVITMLAILKAGATYVPVDPTAPAQRIAYIVDDAQLKVMIASEKHNIFTLVEETISYETLEENRDDELTYSNWTSAGRSDDAAYIIYTSGSTGHPKGVVIPHANVQSLIHATQDDFALDSNDVWTFFHSAAFDFSVWEIWGCLLTGGSLVVVPYWVSRTPSEFFPLLQQEGVTILSQTPTALYQLMEYALRQPTLLDALRVIVLGGEALDSVALLPWFDRYPESQCRVVNMFGITETTVHVTAKTIRRRDALTRSRSVGRPLLGWYVYIKDDQSRLLPLGSTGEIYVGGAGVARHYWNRPELNTERFVTDVFSKATVYRSGDRGVLKDNGELLYEGRLDSQIKLRGFRIELGEIRQNLHRIEGVLSVAVVLNQPDDRHSASIRLDCYLVLDNTTPEAVRQAAAQQLPEYMLPSTYTVVNALPMTTNGKLDVQALPPPEISCVSRAGLQASDREQSQSNPATGVAEQLRCIWSEIFGVDVADTDNFFDLGGNSLLAVRIVTLAHQSGIKTLSIRDLYVHQCIDKLTNQLPDNQNT